MNARCLNPMDSGYPDYGGRGITICERWLGPQGFQNFLADLGPRPYGKTLDRINVNGNYEPGNCRWATAKVQANNQRPRKPYTEPVTTVADETAAITGVEAII